jgi:protease IV
MSTTQFQNPAPESSVKRSKTTDPTISIQPKVTGLAVTHFLFQTPRLITSFIWMIISMIVLVSILAGVAAANSAQQTSSPSALQLQVKKGLASGNGVLIYPLRGAITDKASGGGISSTAGIITEKVEKDFEEIEKNSSIKSVVFTMSTPGGSVYASEILGDLITNLIEKKGQKETVFFYEDIVASGGVWASNKAKNAYIIGSQYGQTGSIGVVLSLPNLKGLADKVGYTETVLKSTPNKDIGNPLRDLDPAERDFLQGQVNEKYNEFVNIVSTSRGKSLEEVRKIANGFVYENEFAKQSGLINEIASIDTAVSRAAKNANLGDTYTTYEIKKPTSVFQSLLGQDVRISFPGTQAIQELEKTLSLSPGVVYALDINRI